jgi:hypothetical protein
MKEIKKFKDFIQENKINESASSITITSKDLSKLFGGSKEEDDEIESEIEDALYHLGRIDSIAADTENLINIEFERGFIAINLSKKTITISS